MKRVLATALLLGAIAGCEGDSATGLSDDAEAGCPADTLFVTDTVFVTDTLFVDPPHEKAVALKWSGPDSIQVLTSDIDSPDTLRYTFYVWPVDRDGNEVPRDPYKEAIEWELYTDTYPNDVDGWGGVFHEISPDGGRVDITIIEWGLRPPGHAVTGFWRGWPHVRMDGDLVTPPDLPGNLKRMKTYWWSIYREP